MTTEQKREIIDKIAVECNLYPYQVEILKKIIIEKQEALIILPRLSGGTMFKKAYREMMDRINEEELNGK